MGPLTAILLSLLLAGIASAQNAANPVDTKSRVKDLVRVQGADANSIEGIGIVVGLTGSGDSPKELSQKLEAAWLKYREALDVSVKDLQNKNAAIVSVSAELPAFQEAGTYIDVHVASIGDAKSLRGGRLLITKVYGPRPISESKAWFVTAEGPLQIEGGALGNLTTAVIPHGGKVDHAAPCTEFEKSVNAGEFTLILKRPDWNVAAAIAQKLNRLPQDLDPSLGSVGAIGSKIAEAMDAGRVKVYVPKTYADPNSKKPGFDPPSFLALVLEQELLLSGSHEPEAIVVINERAGTYGVSGYVTVYPGTVQKGNVRIKIPYQPRKPAAVPNGVATDDAAQQKTASLGDILDNLGAVGFTPSDIIDLIKQMDAQGLINGTVRSE